VRVEKRLNEVVNRLNKTKVERKPDLKGKSLISAYHFSLLQNLRAIKRRQGTS
jgi:hypothetical protein